MRTHAMRKILTLILSVLLLPALIGSAFAHGVPESDIRALSQGENFGYLWLGTKHMVTGYDHLLFLFGVIFFLTRFSTIVKFITAFTIGHSITLLLGTLLGWQINYYLIDAIVALTVCYKALENIDGFKKYLGVEPPSLILAVFVFGLIHGLGLATRLQQFSLPDDDLIQRILSFNVGVELGQVLALSVMVVVLAAWRRRNSFTRFSLLANKGLFTAGLLLFVFQLHGYTHVTNINELGFSADLHSHAHEAMELEELRSRRCDGALDCGGAR